MHLRSLALLPASLLLAGIANAADSCTTLQAEIDAKIRAGGVVNYTLVTVDADAVEAGRFVGSCGNGKKKIVYSQLGVPGGSGASAASGASLLNPAGARARPRAAGMLTECKQGFTGAECNQRAAPAPALPNEKKVTVP